MTLTLLATLLLGGGLASASPAELQPPVRLKVWGVFPVRVESPGHAAPCWADIDGDGKKDLLVGQYGGGKVRVYKNLGDGTLAAGVWLKAEGAVAKVPDVWCCTSSTPLLVDLDGDGRRDILSGSYSRREKPMAGLFWVLHGQADGTFRQAEVLKGTDGEPLIIPLNGRPISENIATRPFAVDWNADGRLDLVVGNASGTFYLFQGQGNGKFLPQPAPIMSGDQPLQIKGAHSDPFAVDWDGDGDLDLLSGSSEGGVQWAENRATPGKMPRLETFRSLIEPGPQHEFMQILRFEDIKGPVSSTRIWVDDINSDGKLDILVGDLAPLLSPADGLTEAEYRKKFAAWDESRQGAADQRNATVGEKEREKATQHYYEVYKRRWEFMKEDVTGFVWLYLRK